MKQVELGIAKFLTPQNVDTQEYWNEHWPVIEMLLSSEAILMERLFFFKENSFQRNDALSLLLIADFVWQQIRKLSGIQGKDERWMRKYLPDLGSNSTKAALLDEFEKGNIEVLENLKWLFGLHTSLRHPTATNFKKHKFLLYDPWPKEQAERLLKTAESLDHILLVFSDSFEESGWMDEVEKKSKLTEKARMFHEKKV